MTINGAGIKVVLQNIAINALGGTYGILLQNAAELDVNGCTVSNFTGAGIYSTAANAKLNVRDTLIRDNLGPTAPGVWLAASTRAVLERVRVLRNGSDGIRAEAPAEVSVKRSILTANARSGIIAVATAGTAGATVEDSLISDNGSDGVTATSSGAGAVAKVSAARNTITRNTDYGVGITAASSGSSVVSLSDNLISQQGLDGVWATGAGAVATASNNTFAGNGTGPLFAALHAVTGGTIHTVKGADGLPNNAGEQTTPTIGNVVPSNPF